MVNIKKSQGTSRSEDRDLRLSAAKDADLLREQVGCIKPDLISAGGVWSSVPKIWEDHELDEISYRVYRIKPLDTVLINFWHPAARQSNALLYYALAGILQAAMGVDARLLDTGR